MTASELLASSPHLVYFGHSEFRAENGNELDQFIATLFAFASDRRCLYAELILTMSSTYEEVSATCDETTQVLSSYILAALTRIHEKYGPIYDPENNFMKIHYSITGA